MKKWSLFLALCLLLVACGHRGPEESQEKPRQIKAETLVLVPKVVVETRNFSGQVRARNQIVLASKISGYVQEVFVKEGEIVEAGAPLLHLDDQPIRDQIKALKASLAAVRKEKEAVSARKRYAQAHYHRLRKLFSAQAATKEEFEQAEAEFRALAAQEKALAARAREIKAELTKTKNILAYTFLKSPAKALVVKRLADPGTFVVAQTPVLVLDDLSSGYQFEVELDEKFLSKVKIGEKYWILFPSLKKGSWGEVKQVISQINPQTRTFLVKLDLSGEGLSSGLYGRLYFPVAERKALLIPWKAVVSRGDLTGAMVVEKDGRARFRVIRLGRSFREENGRFLPQSPPEELSQARQTSLWAEVLSGLKPEEKIVVSNLFQVRDGDLIK